MIRLFYILILIAGFMVTGSINASACPADEEINEVTQASQIVSSTKLSNAQQSPDLACHGCHCCLSCRIISVNMSEQCLFVQSPDFFITYFIYNSKFGRNFNAAAWHPPKSLV